MLFGFYTVYSSLFLALGKGTEGFILGACRQGICFVPVILIFPIHRELIETEKQATIAGTNEAH